jgi:hypothetical protein
MYGFGSRRRESRGELMTYRRHDGSWIGFVPVGREWFQFRVKSLQTAEGPRLITSFYLVVAAEEAHAFRDENRALTSPDLGEARVTGYWQVGPPDVAELMCDRECLPYRAFAIKGSPEDREGSLAEAIRAIRRALRRKAVRLALVGRWAGWHTLLRKAAHALREVRMSPDSPLYVMPEERAEDMFTIPAATAAGGRTGACWWRLNFAEQADLLRRCPGDDRWASPGSMLPDDIRCLGRTVACRNDGNHVH